MALTEQLYRKNEYVKSEAGRRDRQDAQLRISAFDSIFNKNRYINLEASWLSTVPESRLRVLSWTSQWHPLNLPPGCLMTLSNCRIQFVSCPQTAGSGSGIGLRTRDPPGSDTGITKSYSLPSEPDRPMTDSPPHNYHHSESKRNI